MAGTKINTKIKVLSREVKATYLQSVQISAGEQDAGALAGEGGGVGSTHTGVSKPGSPGFFGLFAKAASSSSMDSSDSGWIISRQWKETSFDRSRYAIGIREIGISHYRFAPVSELVSIPFRSPKEIYKVQLRVVEGIPAAFPLGRRYLEYYITPDNGKNWHRINPLDHPTIVDDDGQVVPRTITFNTEIGGTASDLHKFVETDEPVFELRYRIVMRTAEDLQDADRYTPTAKKMKILMYPRSGL